MDYALVLIELNFNFLTKFQHESALNRSDSPQVKRNLLPSITNLAFHSENELPKYACNFIKARFTGRDFLTHWLKSTRTVPRPATRTLPCIMTPKVRTSIAIARQTPLKTISGIYPCHDLVNQSSKTVIIIPEEYSGPCQTAMTERCTKIVKPLMALVQDIITAKGVEKTYKGIIGFSLLY